MQNTTDDYDKPWKGALRQFFPEFMEFYFPDVYREIDWTKKPRFEEKDLSKLWRESEVPGRYVDKLVEVREGERHAIRHINRTHCP